MKRIYSILLFVCLLPWTAWTQTSGAVYEFLSLPSSVYAAGLGGSVVSSPEKELSLTLHNPALLSEEMHQTLLVGYMNYVADIQLGQAAYAHKINENSSWMVAARYLDYGQATATDLYDQPLGVLYAKDIALSGGYSFRLSDYWRGGINSHLIYSAIDQYTSFGMAVDLGLHYHHPNNRFWAGLCVRHLGSQFKPYTDRYESLPWDIQAGITHALEHAPFRLNLTIWGVHPYQASYFDSDLPAISNDYSVGQHIFRHLLMGIELVPSESFQVGVGFNPRRRIDMALEQRQLLTGFSASFSLKIRKVRVGASFASYHPSGNSLLMNFSTQLGN